MPFNTTGNRNIAIGTIALFTNKANSGSIAIGYLANQYADDRTSNPVETHNIAIGSSALSGQSPAANNIGIRNIAIGSNTLYRYTSGSNNVAIGNFSGDYITSGSGNIMLGNDAGGTINVSNKLFIDNSNTNDPLIKGDFSTNELKINSKLRVGGTGDTPTATLQVDGSVAVTGKIPLTSSQNNLNVAGKSVIRVSGGSLVTLTGLAGGVDGMVIYIYTDGTDLNIPQLSGLSATGNQFHLAGGFPSDTMSITGSGGAHFIYDAESGLWRLIGFKL